MKLEISTKHLFSVTLCYTDRSFIKVFVRFKHHGPGTEFIKKNSCSTQLSLKLQFLINTEIAQIH